MSGGSNPLSTAPWWDSYYAGHHQADEHWEWYLPMPMVEQFIHRAVKGEWKQQIHTTSDQPQAEQPSVDSSSLSILHPGCGSSELSLFLARFASSLINIDFSSSAIAHMTQQIASNPLYSHVQFRLMDVRQMSFPSDSFDLIVDKGTLDCTVLDENPLSGYLYMRECHRVLKEGGILLCFSLFPFFERIPFLEQGVKVTGKHKIKIQRQTETQTDTSDNEALNAAEDCGDVFEWVSDANETEFSPLNWRIVYQAIPISPLEMPHQPATHLYIAIKKKMEKENGADSTDGQDEPNSQSE